jgi:two-component system chemotaxis response regulator CheB
VKTVVIKELLVIKVLIVDDSAFVRRSLISILEKDKDIQIVGTAANGEEAVAKAAELDPDVVTMDVEMPKMNGLKALERIMASNPIPVIMVSSMTSEGATTTLRAMELGAMDYIPKLGSAALRDTQRLEKELCPKIKAISRRKAFLRLKFKNATGRRAVVNACSLPPGKQAPPPAPRIFHAGGSLPFEVVAVGVSTGGPPAVQKVLSELPGDFPVPVLIAQHMPASFTGPFAERLNSQCAINVKEAAPVERVRPGTAYICPGGRHLRLENKGGSLMAVVTEDPKEALYKPSANVLMETAGIAAGTKALGVTLTGMGYDGLEGTKVLKQRGGWAIAQNEESCVVYGMPKAVVDAGLADEIVDIKDMSATILAHFHRKA